MCTHVLRCSNNFYSGNLFRRANDRYEIAATRAFFERYLSAKSDYLYFRSRNRNDIDARLQREKKENNPYRHCRVNIQLRVA